MVINESDIDDIIDNAGIYDRPELCNKLKDVEDLDDFIETDESVIDDFIANLDYGDIEDDDEIEHVSDLTQINMLGVISTNQQHESKLTIEDLLKM